MRISDWSSDVCSSDLIHLAVEQHVDRDRHARVDAAPVVRLRRQFLPQADAQPVLPGIRQAARGKLFAALIVLPLFLRLLQFGRASGGERGCPYVEITEVAVSLKTKYKRTRINH